MIKNGLLPCMVLFAMSVHAAPPGQKSCALKPLASVDMAVTEENVFVPVAFNDTKGWLQLATDEAFSFVNQYVSQELKFPTDASSEADGFGLRFAHQPVRQMVSIDRPMLGSTRLPVTQWVVHPRIISGPVIEGKPVLGALAMNILWRYDFELNFTHRKFTLYAHHTCPGNVVYWADRFGQAPIYVADVGNLYLPVKIEGKTLEASFGTSRPVSYLNVTIARRLFGIDEHSPNVAPEGANAAESPAMLRVSRLSSGELSFVDVQVQLISTPKGCRLSSVGRPSGALGIAGCYGVYPVVIGRSEMAQRRWYFATQEKMVYFTDATLVN